MRHQREVVLRGDGRREPPGGHAHFAEGGVGQHEGVPPVPNRGPLLRAQRVGGRRFLVRVRWRQLVERLLYLFHLIKWLCKTF